MSKALRAVLDRLGGEYSEDIFPTDWPPALAKACCDPFDYAACIVGLGVVRFYIAHPAADGWLHLDFGSFVNPHLPFPFDRGIDVRIEDIRWIADAPEGS